MIDEKQIKINLIIVHLYNVFGLENNTDIIHWEKKIKVLVHFH